MAEIPPIYFYLPESDWRDDIPEQPDVYWLEFEKGIYAWTIQTYLYLKTDGFPCQLVNTIPNEGIVVAHRDSFPYELRPTSKVLMVCIKADRNLHPYAHLHIVQNPQETKTFKNTYFIPHWIQPGLIPRDSQRGELFENIGYFGISHNLAKELKAPSWRKKLRELGLNWKIIAREKWHDYSQIDAVIGVRRFKEHNYTNKPATKLYNSWLAGVPAILGNESAFQYERKNELDYIEVNSFEEIILALENLKNNPQLRHQMSENGKIRAKEISTNQLINNWRKFLINIAIPAYQNWYNSTNWYKNLYSQKCFFRVKSNALKAKINSFSLFQNNNEKYS